MPSVYPLGFPSGLTVKGVPLVQTHPGQAYWVSNNTTGLLVGHRGGSDQNKGTYDSPFATLNYAFTQCIANRGDIIFIKPGHTETISTGSAMAWNIAGVAVVGLGSGSMRPTFTLDSLTSSAVAVSAANISVQNCIFAANLLSIAACFVLTTAKWFTVQGCLFQEGAGGILNFLNIIKSTGIANTVDGLTVTDCNWNSTGSGATVNSFILSANDIDSATWQRNFVKLVNTRTAAVFATISAGVLTNLICTDNVAISQQVADTGGGFINVGGTTSTGVVARNLLGDLSTTDLFITTTVGLTYDNNKKTGVITASGYLLPATDS